MCFIDDLTITSMSVSILGIAGTFFGFLGIVLVSQPQFNFPGLRTAFMYLCSDLCTFYYCNYFQHAFNFDEKQGRMVRDG
jgi:hypothetical protein